MFLRVGTKSVRSLNPFLMVLLLFCSDAMWFARFSSSVSNSLVVLAFLFLESEQEEEDDMLSAEGDALFFDEGCCWCCF